METGPHLKSVPTKIIVGGDVNETTFYAHPTLLSQHSDFHRNITHPPRPNRHCWADSSPQVCRIWTRGLTKVQIIIRACEVDNIKTFHISEDTLTRDFDFSAAALKKDVERDYHRQGRSTRGGPGAYQHILELRNGWRARFTIYSIEDGNTDDEDEGQEWIRLAGCWLLGWR